MPMTEKEQEQVVNASSPQGLTPVQETEEKVGGESKTAAKF